MNLTKTTFIIAIACTSFSCKKDSEDPKPATPSELLVGKKWQLRTLTQSYPGLPEADLYTFLGSCSRDDYRRFDTPNTTVYDEGPTKCFTNDPQTQLGVWALSSDNKQLTITDPVVSSETYTITELTDTSLKMFRLIPQSTGLNSTQTFGYVVIP